MKIKKLFTLALGCVLAFTAIALAACAGKIAVVSVTLNETELVLEEGLNALLTATVSPSDATYKTIIWESDNEEVATVVEGTVTAIKQGTATITATADGKSAACAVTVKEAFNLPEYKENLNTQLNAYKNDSLYNLENENKVATAKANGIAAITAASDKAAADKAFSDAKTAIDAIETIKIGATADSVEAILDAVKNAKQNQAIVIKNGVYSFNSGITVAADGVAIIGEGEVVLEKTGDDRDSIFTVTADNVMLKNLIIRVSGSIGENNIAPIFASGENLTLSDCTVERSMNDLTETVIPYGLLVRANNGILTAKNCTFIAPYNPEKASADSPSVIEATSGVNFDSCKIHTDGYGFFSQHVTKGVVKNTLFTGISGRPILGFLNSTLLDGIIFDGCTFDMGENSTVTAGSYTFKNCVFDFENTPSGGAGNAINIYMLTGNIVIENNTFNLKDGIRGINFTSASWASGSHDGSKVSIKGNTFNGTGKQAVYVNADWENISETDIKNNNTLNDNIIEFAPKA